MFVHLARGFGAAAWHQRYRSRTLIGINEPYPYGYHLASAWDCEVHYSQDTAEGIGGWLARGAARALLGFDWVHAFRNRRGIYAADVVWTHTESQYLAVLLLLKMANLESRPKLIAQSVWLFDKWPRLNPLHRFVYARLIGDADILTVHSPQNLAVARRLFPKTRSKMVPFGINTGIVTAPKVAAFGRPVRIIAVGNDRHRDWGCLRAAFEGTIDYEVTIVSTTIDSKLVRGAANIRIKTVDNNEELQRLYQQADVAVIPLKKNLHASGITAVQEAILWGLPVACTGTGGLEAYFPPDEIEYSEPEDGASLREAVERIVHMDPARRAERIRAAQRRMRKGPLNSKQFVFQHVRLSRQLLGVDPTDPASRSATGTDRSADTTDERPNEAHR